ncbi:MAG: fatty acid desaturase [Lentisphaeraceae bacterium]|nr:fatty acid desaturase [Lentisphaeraceae bacterium]
MNVETPEIKQNWLNTLVLFSTPVLALIFVPYYGINYGFTGFDWFCFVFFMFATGTGITAGYHRLWSHKAYTASFPVRLWLAYWGGCATQNSILKWSADHRRHHKFVDSNEKDPYSAKMGFWYSHMGWVIKDYQGSVPDLSNINDLKKDPIIMLQDKIYLPLVLFSNIIVPIFIGWAYNQVTGSTGSIYGVLVLAGLLRFVLNHHFTFLINSACHIFGSQPYSSKDTSRDNFFLALFTYGEGYHNYHHTFQADYRNGIKWYHYDPTKWMIKTLSWFNLTTNLKEMPEKQILKATTLQTISKKKEDLYKRLDLIKENNLYQKVESSYSDLAQSLNEWVEESQKYFRFCKDDSKSSEEKQSYAKKLEELKAAFEQKKAQLMELLSAPSVNALQAV